MAKLLRTIASSGLEPDHRADGVPFTAVSAGRGRAGLLAEGCDLVQRPIGCQRLPLLARNRIDAQLAQLEHPVTQLLEINDGAQAAADQPLDLDGPAVHLGAPIARLARIRASRKHPVLGGEPALPFAL